MAEPEKLVKLFERATNPLSSEVDLTTILDICDRINSRRRSCVEGIEYFKQLFK
jgi:hypothetical protein